MRFYKPILLLIFTILASCTTSAPKAETPFDALKTYIQAIKKKDTTQMKLLLTKGSIKMAEEEAKAQNVTVDDIIKRETLFSESQSRVEFKNEKIDGEKATIEVRNSFGSWDVVPFAFEDGEWKIAKDRYLEEQTKKTEEEMKKLDQQIEQGVPDATMPASSTTPLDIPEATDTNPPPMPSPTEAVPNQTPPVS